MIQVIIFIVLGLLMLGGWYINYDLKKELNSVKSDCDHLRYNRDFYKDMYERLNKKEEKEEPKYSSTCYIERIDGEGDLVKEELSDAGKVSTNNTTIKVRTKYGYVAYPKDSVSKFEKIEGDK